MENDVVGGLKVLVEARKSIGIWFGPDLELGLEPNDLDGGLIDVSRDPGLEMVPLDGGRIGLSGWKKLDDCFLAAGEGGIFWRVSIALSDNEGLDLRLVSCGFLAVSKPPSANS